MAGINANADLNLGLGFGSNDFYAPVSGSPVSGTPAFAGQGDSFGSSNNLQGELIQLEMQMMQLMEEMMQILQQMQGGQNGSNPSGGSNPGGGSNPSGGGCGAGSGSGGGNPCGGGQGENFYGNLTGSSWGDPHQQFNATETGNYGAYGSNPTQGEVPLTGQVSGSANNMQSQSDLFDANQSFLGGYQVSTQTTAPNSSGVTYNQSATVSTGRGRDTVTMGADGQVTVLDNGRELSLQKGQTIQLGSGAQVTMNKDGSVTVDDKNMFGGDASTTLSWNGKGVDVHVSGQNIYAGGFLTTLPQPQTEQVG